VGVTLQVNPAIMLILDAQNNVIDVEGLDERGEMLVARLDVKDKEISEALSLIADALAGAGLPADERRMFIALHPVRDRIGEAELNALTGIVTQTLGGRLTELGLVMEIKTVVLTAELADAVRVTGLFPADYVDVVVEVGISAAMGMLNLQGELGIDPILFKEEFGTIGSALADMMEVGIAEADALTILNGALQLDPTLEELTTITAAMIDLHEVGAKPADIALVFHLAFDLMEGQIVAGVFVDRALVLEEITTITAAKADMFEAGIPADAALATLRTALAADPKLEELTTITAAMIDLIEKGVSKEEALARIQGAIQADPTLEEFDDLIEVPAPQPPVRQQPDRDMPQLEDEPIQNRQNRRQLTPPAPPAPLAPQPGQELPEEDL